MKINTQKLLSAVKFSAQISNHKTPLPVLNSLLFRASPSGISVVGSNLEMFASSHVECDRNGWTDICVPARKLVDFLGTCDGEDSEVEQSKNRFSIRCGNSKSEFSTIPAVEFPLNPDPKNPNVVELKESELRRAIDAVKFGMSTDIGRAILNSMFLSVSGGNAVFIGADGRMALRYETPAEGELSVIIPRGTVENIVRALDSKGDGTIRIIAGENMIVFESEKWRFSSKQVEGGYPNIDLFIKRSPIKIKLPRQQTIKSLKRAQIFTSDLNVRTMFKFGDGKLSISMKEDHGVEDYVEIADAPSLEFCANPFYVDKILSSMTEDYVEMEFTDTFSPVLLIEPKFLALFMLIRG